MLTRRTVGTPAPRRGRPAPAALVRAAAMSVFFGRAVWAANAVRRRIAELAFLFVAVVLVLFGGAVRTARTERRRIAIAALGHS